MEEDSVFTKRFIDAMKKPKEDRSEQDTEYLCYVLKKLSEFCTLDIPAVRNVLESSALEVHSRDSLLYKPGDSVCCWYYVMSGSVMISNIYLYTVGCSFGQSIDTDVRTDSCHVLEDSELLKINYTPEEMQRLHRRASHSKGGSSSLTGSLEAVFSSSSSTTVESQSKLPAKGSRHLSPPADMSRSVGRDKRGQRARSVDADHFLFDETTIQTLSQSNESLNQALEGDPIKVDDEEVEDRSSTSVSLGVSIRSKKKAGHRRSAPPISQVRDSVGSLDYLSESQVDQDSDDEDIQSETSSAAGMDSVYEVLSKPPLERTEEDIDRVMDVLQYMPAFANMTSNIRRGMFHVLMMAHLDNEGSVLIDDGDTVDKWYVVLNGQLKLVRESEQEKFYHVGEPFGVSPTLKILPHNGRLVTATKDCQVCYVGMDEYGRVLAQWEENIKRIEEDGKVVAVLEKRAVNVKKEGYFVIQATPEKLLSFLVEESVDETFHSDFLLTYRSFLHSPEMIVEKIKDAWQCGVPEQRDRINMIVLDWVSEHFLDFECSDEMNDFLDWFEDMLIEEGKLDAKKAFDKARVSNAKVRPVELERENVSAPLGFEIVGGWELFHPVFISTVVADSRAAEAGLRSGDVILSINENRCDRKELREVLNILHKNYKLSMTVRSNIPEFKHFMLHPPDPPPEPVRTHTVSGHSAQSHAFIARSNSASVGLIRPVIGKRMAKASSPTPGSNVSKEKKKEHKGKTPGFLKPIVRSLTKPSMDGFRKRMRHEGGDSPSGPLKARKNLRPRKSEENLLDDSASNGGPIRPATSAEDIHMMSTDGGGVSPKPRNNSHVIDQVVKLHAPDHTTKLMDVTSSTTVAELINRGVKDFYPDRFVAAPSEEFCICMVTVTTRTGPVRNSVLPGHLTDLANFIGLDSRYYLKERAYHGTLVQDDEAERIVRESRQWEHILNLKAMQVAEELTRLDSEVFCSIESSEYISDLWKKTSTAPRHHLEVFEEIPNDEMYWVITTIVSETNAAVRGKIIKHFIKIAKCCKQLKNFNTMFHILSGLNHGLVQRLRSSWEKVPHKRRRTFEELSSYMNPFHNMSKYREIQRITKPPLIPFFPIMKKDLTFLYDGNDTVVDGLINFEKLRMLSRQIKVIKNFCDRPMVPSPPEVDLNQLGVFNRTIGSIHGSLRFKQRSPHHMISLTENALKKVYTHNRMSKMVRKHLSRKYVLQDESYLEKIVDSQEKLAMAPRKTPSSPLSKGKKTAAGNRDKLLKRESANLSPSPTSNSLNSDVSVPVNLEACSTPPISTCVTNNLAGLSAAGEGALTPTRSPSVNSFNSNTSSK